MAVKRNWSKVLFIFLILQLICNILFLGQYLGHLDIRKFFAASSVNSYNTNKQFWCYNGTKYYKTLETPIGIGMDEMRKKTMLTAAQGDREKDQVDRDESDVFHMPLPIEFGVPLIVHQILWTNSMTFRNYLSILSVWKILKPYQIRLYVRTSFAAKSFVYDDWYQKSISRIPALQVEKPEFLDKVKDDISYTEEINNALTVMKNIGGIYVNINTMMMGNVWLRLNGTFEVGMTGNMTIGYLALSQNSAPPDSRNIPPVNNVMPKCVPASSYTGSEICCTIPQHIFPYNIMWDNSSFSFLARTLFYGKPEYPKLNSSFPPIPKIVHYVWFGKGHLDYSMYLSFLSTQKFIKPVKVLIYVDANNTCPYLKKMGEFNNTEVIFYGSLKSIFQTPVRAVSHASDFLRADVLYRFGGMYIDWDVYWLKPIDDLVNKGYETIASLDYYDDMFPRKDYPDTINMGVLLSRPRSRFISIWRDSYRSYTGGHHTWHAVENVYKLYEEHPDLLFIDKRLQIMCHELRCHPLWLKDYKSTKAHHEFDFTKDVYAVHFTFPTPEAFKSEKLVKESKGYFADMARHILGTRASDVD